MNQVRSAEDVRKNVAEDARDAEDASESGRRQEERCGKRGDVAVVNREDVRDAERTLRKRGDVRNTRPNGDAEDARESPSESGEARGRRQQQSRGRRQGGRQEYASYRRRGGREGLSKPIRGGTRETSGATSEITSLKTSGNTSMLRVLTKTRKTRGGFQVNQVRNAGDVMGDASYARPYEDAEDAREFSGESGEERGGREGIRQK